MKDTPVEEDTMSHEDSGPAFKSPLQIKVIWEQRGMHIHCAVFQGRGEGYTWEKTGDLVFDSDGFAAFTKPWATTWVIEGRKHADAHPEGA